MLVSYNWLKKYIDLSDVSAEKLADAITKGGLEVEGYHKLASGSKLVIGQITECIDHPDSDHLHVCQVNTGKDTRQIVCGAPNAKKGLKVIVALPGCVLPGGEIKEGVIRGQQSLGMLCSLAELGVDKKTLTEKQLSGIEELNDDAIIGNENVLEYLGLDDTILDVSLTPNRADCLSVWALAKEIGAILDKKVNLPNYSYACSKKPSDLKIASKTDRCTYFLGTVINQLTIKESPEWLKKALHSVGVKSINNVVDISNYVMLETGQPLHFYDLNKIINKEITVVTGLDEMYTALDGQQYHVLKDDIMITNQNKAIGYAGIMGGDDSKIDENTKGIIIEAAHFDMVSVRNTSRRLDLITDAASRFSKGIDPKAAEIATARSIQLLLELADAKEIEETVTYGDSGYKQTKVVCDKNSVNKLLGTNFTSEQMVNVFERLDFSPVVNNDTITTTIPSYRWDISLWQDLAEEVIRILGYDNIVSTLPNMPTTQGCLAENGKNKRIIKEVLNGFGFYETLNYSLTSCEKNELGIYPIGPAVKIANAAGEDRRYFRTSLLPSLLDVVSYNVARGNVEYGLFEIGNVYDNDGNEQSRLSLALSKRTTISQWQKQIKENDFYTLKGIILAILDKLGYDEKRVGFIVSNVDKVLHPNKSAAITLDKNIVGYIGVTHPSILKQYDIKECLLGEINLSAIFACKQSKIKYVTVNKYPSVSYDLALVVKDDISSDQITNCIKKSAGNLLEKVAIFDVFKSETIGIDNKSIGVTVTYRSTEKTLTESDVNPIHKAVLSALTNNLNAKLRD